MRKILLREEKGMEQEIRNADLSDMMCDLLYLLGCGVNEKMPAKAYIKTFQEAFCGSTYRNRVEKGWREASGRVGTEYCQSNP